AKKPGEQWGPCLFHPRGGGGAIFPPWGYSGNRGGGGGRVFFFLQNDPRHDLPPPLRSRCVYSWLEPPTPREEVRILRARVTAASPQLLANIVKIINCVRGIGGGPDKPRP